MEKLVTGFGGFFFRAKDANALSKWYDENLGINSLQSGEVWQQQAGQTVFMPFKQDTTYFGSPAQQFMINFRVTDLDALLAQLAEKGVRIDEKKQDDEYGKFAWIYDPEGNKIELWQPVE
ncbi:VOC family protein [Mucilaginibacter roseus]|uniref:VOC family protein n=1 Tax=Mucilaginibacter roseus TaxID=1528868 RepID=A0ABS8TZX1_9SPHI|nr:VOC family protein [Mucilaginibacter roseus]MCD8739380.1 VOC family protein [Mucilaginibacter roseus]